MLKLITDTGKIFKSFEALDVYNFILRNKALEYQFYHGFTPISKSDFLKLFLNETKDADAYIKLEVLLYERIDLIDYIKKYEK